MKDSSGIYFIASIGAIVYYIQHAATFWSGVAGFFKGIFWPAFVLYKVLHMLNM